VAKTIPNVVVFPQRLVQHFLNKGVEKEAGKQYIRKRP
jgi:hypothetical protein